MTVVSPRRLSTIAFSSLGEASEKLPYQDPRYDPQTGGGIAKGLRLDWHERAKCYRPLPEGIDFFAGEDDGRGKGVKEIVEATKRFCFDCPAIEACADFAHRNREEFGIWAGRTASERNVGGSHGGHKTLGIRTFVCAICGNDFEAARARATCSDICQHKRDKAIKRAKREAVA